MLKIKQLSTSIVLCMLFCFSTKLFASDSGISQQTLEYITQAEEDDSDENIPLAKKYFLEGKAFFDQGKYEEALDSFKSSLYEDPTDQLLNHLLGRAAFELGNFEEALFAYERVLVLNPNLPMTRLEKARTHMALGSNLEAKEELEKVLEADIPPGVRANVENLLAQIGADRKATYSGVFLMSQMWDSNVTLGTGPLPLTDTPGINLFSDPTQQSDRIFSAALVLNHAYPLAEQGWTWKNGLTAFLSDNTTVRTNSLNLGVINSGLDYKYQRHSCSGSLSWTGIVLDNELYQVNPALSFSYSYAYSQRLNMRMGWNYTKRHHFSTAGTNQVFGFVHSYNAGFSFIQDAKNSWDFGWAHKFDKSPREGDVGLAYNRYEVTGRYSRVLTNWLSLNLTGNRRHDEYTSPAPTSSTGAQRSDIALIGSAGFSIKIKPTVLWDITTTYYDNESNIAVNTYQVKQLGTTLTMIF